MLVGPGIEVVFPTPSVTTADTVTGPSGVRDEASTVTGTSPPPAGMVAGSDAADCEPLATVTTTVSPASAASALTVNRTSAALSGVISVIGACTVTASGATVSMTVAGLCVPGLTL